MDNPARCPQCAAALPNLVTNKIYFADFGKGLDPPIWAQATVE
jgi:hypothetical protein